MSQLKRISYYSRKKIPIYDMTAKINWAKYNKEVKTEHRMVEISITINRVSNDFL